MNEVKITHITPRKYTRGTKTQIIKREIPEAWKEVDFDKKSLFKFLSIQQYKKVERRNVERVRLLLDVKEDVFRGLKTSDVAWIISGLSFMETPFTAPLLKNFGHRGNLFVVLDNMLENMTAFEFERADNYIRKALDGNENAMWCLLAVLARLDGKQATSKNEINDRAVLLYGLDKRLVAYLLEFYSNCRDKIHRMAKVLFEDGDSKSGGLNLGWNGIFLSLAEENVFGSYQEVLETPIHDIIIYLLKRHEDNKKLQRELELQKQG